MFVRFGLRFFEFGFGLGFFPTPGDDRQFNTLCENYILVVISYLDIVSTPRHPLVKRATLDLIKDAW